MTAEEIELLQALRSNALTAEKERLALYLNNPNLPERRLEIFKDKDNALTMKLNRLRAIWLLLRKRLHLLQI